MGTGGTPAPATSQQDYLSVRDALANYGLDLRGQFSDDHAALQHIIGQLRSAEQAQQLAQYGQQYLRVAPEFQAWQRQQQEEAAKKQAQQQGWWKAPEYDPSWVSKLRKNDQGNIEVIPGNDPAIAQKYLAWAEHQRGFIDKFSADPIGAIKPGIEQVVREVAQQLMGQQMGQYTAQTQAQRVVEQNSSWLHQRDERGQLVYDRGHMGQPVPRLSEAGRRYMGYVQVAEQIGITSVQGQHDYAQGLVQRDYLMAQYQQGQSQQQAGDAAKARFIAQAQAGQANGQQNHTPALPAGNTNGQRPVRGDARGLQQAMMTAMQANGFQPSDVLTR